MESTKAVVLAIIIALTSPVLADCPNNVQPIKKGEAAVCDGFLFNSETEMQARKNAQDAAYYEVLYNYSDKKNKIQEDQNSILEKRLKLYMDESETLSKRVANTETTESLYRFGYFALGVLVTGVILRNVRQ